MQNNNYPTEPARKMSDADINRLFDELRYKEKMKRFQQKKMKWVEFSTVPGGGED